MNAQHHRELENRMAEPLLEAERRDEAKRAELRSRANDIIGEMRAEGKVLKLTEEEESLLWAFRRFKLRMRKQGEIFTWQTRMPEDVLLAEETATVLHPDEVAQSR